MKLIHVFSDNEIGLFSKRAYKELVLQMSTGDFHTHKHRELEVEPGMEYVDIDDDNNFILIKEVR